MNHYTACSLRSLFSRQIRKYALELRVYWVPTL